MTPRSLPDEPHPEIGLAIAVPMDQQRLSATEETLRRFSRPVSAASGGIAPPVNMPLANPRGDGDEAVSVVSDLNEHQAHEPDLDDMSSVSSLGDDDVSHPSHG